MSNPFHTDRILEDMQRMKRELPILIANQAQVYFTHAFTQQGLGSEQWKEVKRREEGTPEYKYPKYKGLSRRTSPILVRSGNLRRAESNSIRNATWDSVKLVNALAYASYQNEGTATIDARPFMKQTPQLLAKQTKLITEKFGDTFYGRH